MVAPGDLKSSPGSSDAASQPAKWEYAIRHPVPARCIVLAIGQFSLFVDDRPPAVLSGAAEFLIPAEDVAGMLMLSCRQALMYKHVVWRTVELRRLEFIATGCTQFYFDQAGAS